MKTLTISIEHLDAEMVAREVATFGVAADILPGFAVTKGKVEKSAEIRFHDAKLTDVFEVFDFLTLSWGLTCAWLDDSEGYAGCILEHPSRSTFPLYKSGASNWTPGDTFPRSERG